MEIKIVVEIEIIVIDVVLKSAIFRPQDGVTVRDIYVKRVI